MTDPFNPSKITQGLFYTTHFSEIQTENHTDKGISPRDKLDVGRSP